MRRLQREIYNLNKWRSENSLQEQKIKDYDRVIEQLKKQVADQNDMITKMVYGSRKKKSRRRWATLTFGFQTKIFQTTFLT